MNTFSAAVFDLDGTLLDGNGNLNETNRNMLVSLRRDGIVVIICTGRPVYSLMRILPAGCADCAIACNGQTAVYFECGETIAKEELNEQDILAIHRECRRHIVVLTAVRETDSPQWSAPGHPVSARCYDLLHHLVRRIQGWKTDAVTQLPDTPPVASAPKVCAAGLPSTLIFLQKRLADRYSCFLVNPFWLEILKKGTDKGSAVRDVLARYGISPDNAVCFGDGENDIPLFDACGRAVAVRNAMPNVRRHADDIAPSNRQNGVYRWISAHRDEFRSR